MINYQEQNSMHCNYAFYFGATNDNLKLGFLKTLMVVEMFVGSSTGDLLVKDDFYIEQVIKILLK